MKKIFLWIIGLTLICATVVHANPVTVSGEGSSKEQALYSALRRAVEQGLGILIQSETAVVDVGQDPVPQQGICENIQGTEGRKNC
jgi:hypothetical protein